MTRRLRVPIYDATVFIVVADDLYAERARKKWVDLFGPAPEYGYDALCSNSGGSYFALFFNRKRLSRKIEAHEVFHLTHRIMEWAGIKFDHETGALLNGYLSEQVSTALKKNKL